MLFMTRSLVALILTLILTAPLRATTCGTPLPANAVVTPACTWIVEQWDPGVWLDNLGQLWSKVTGSSKAVIVGWIGKW